MKGAYENFSEFNDAPSPVGDSSEKTKSIEQKKDGGSFSEIIRFILIAVIIVAPIRIFVAEPYVVNGASMSPTFESADYLIVDKISYRLSRPERGDIIVFRFPNDTSKFFIKRVVGLPNETISLRDGRAFIFDTEHPDGFSIEESYVENQSFENLERVLSEDEYFVMGDNRGASSDSRSWGILPRKLITGKVFLRLLPVSRASLYPGETDF